MNIQDFDYSVDLLLSILWQYNDAVNLQGLITKKQSWYDINQSQFWSDWYGNVFNLVTANEFGLNVWSFILNVPLFIPTQVDPDGKPIWGFNELVSFPTYENSYVNFNNGNFSVRNQITVLTLEEQRFILRLRYFQLISRGAIPEINSFLNYLLTTSAISPTGEAWVLDGFNMTMTYVFNFDISENLRIVLTEYDLLPRPAGVGLNYIVWNGMIFGFGSLNQNFTNGCFYPSTFI